MKKEKNFIYSVLKPIYTILLIILFRPKVIGKENIPESGPIIFAGNHKHAVDPTMVMMSTKRLVHFMAKEELFKGLHGWAFKNMGLIKVRRGKSNPGAIIDAENVLNNGGTIGIFPEGTRNKGEEELLRFRTGTVRLAQKTNTLIVPFGIKNKYKLCRKNVILEFGKPIDVNNMEIDEANDKLRNEVLKLLRK
jgi:1-acyl-sn-glycerol-3-phosphate acyltransferase